MCGWLGTYICLVIKNFITRYNSSQSQGVTHILDLRYFAGIYIVCKKEYSPKPFDIRSRAIRCLSTTISCLKAFVRSLPLITHCELCDAIELLLQGDTFYVTQYFHYLKILK